MAGMDAACEWMRELLEERRRDPKDDMLTVFATETALPDLPEPNFRTTVVTVIQFLLAGHETTTNLLGNGPLALLRRPESLERLQRDPTLIDSAIEEMLRFDSPLQYLTRRAASPVRLEGELIEEGELVLAVLGSANRDENTSAAPTSSTSRAPRTATSPSASTSTSASAPRSLGSRRRS